MRAEELRALQAPLKERYRSDPESARVTLCATGRLGEDVTCSVDTPSGPAVAGLHPATGGDGSRACSGDMLLQALAACAGVTLSAVATAMRLPIAAGTVAVEGDLDFRGTLGVSKAVPVGFREIRMHYELETTAPEENVERLLQLTERYCVVYQTLAGPCPLRVTSRIRRPPS